MSDLNKKEAKRFIYFMPLYGFLHPLIFSKGAITDRLIVGGAVYIIFYVLIHGSEYLWKKLRKKAAQPYSQAAKL